MANTDFWKDLIETQKEMQKQMQKEMQKNVSSFFDTQSTSSHAPAPPKPTTTSDAESDYSQQLEQLEILIDRALSDGELTVNETQVLFKRAQSMGMSFDEFEIVLNARRSKLSQQPPQQPPAASAPKSNKYGNIKECPHCHAGVQSYELVCPECGYAFEGIDANSAIKELYGLLQKATEKDRMERIIDSYPIPMEKATLLAFITWLRPQCTDTSNPLFKAYFRKYTECINKIKISCANDKELQAIIQCYEKDKRKLIRKKYINATIKNELFWIILGIIVAALLLLWIFFNLNLLFWLIVVVGVAILIFNFVI